MNHNGIEIAGIGSVSPAGWGTSLLWEAINAQTPLPTTSLSHPSAQRTYEARTVPPSPTRPEWLKHPRMRRTSPISQFMVGAALEALGLETPSLTSTTTLGRLGIIACVMDGCVQYSRRFFAEALEDPRLASPLLFPETVFNAPASHIGTLLGTPLRNLTIVGDTTCFVQALADAAEWILSDTVDACLVVAGEEADWTTIEASHLFDRRAVLAEGAGALLLRKASATSSIVLGNVSDPITHVTSSRAFGTLGALSAARAQLPSPLMSDLLVDGCQGCANVDADELETWEDWQGLRLSPAAILGNGMGTASAWQCVLAVDALRRKASTASYVSVRGIHGQSIVARFATASTRPSLMRCDAETTV